MGRGIMVSAFYSRHFGFGMEITKQQLDEVNKYRENIDTEYKDVEAANFLNV